MGSGPAAAPKLPLTFASRREIGYRRQENQDQVAHFASPWGEVFVLADGMGGHQGGSIAANMATSGFERHLLSLSSQLPLETALSEALRLTNADIVERGQTGRAGEPPMGSTIVVLVVQDRSFVLAHLGDSRAYLFHSGKMKQLTRDHTAAQQLLDAGLISERELLTHPDASVLTRALGQGPRIEVEMSASYPLSGGELILLCSDGLSGYVPDNAIEQVLRARRDAQQAADALVELALAAGGYDNISLWTIRAGEPNARKTVPEPQDAGGHRTEKEAGPRLHRRLLLLIAVLGALAGGTWVALKNWPVRHAGPAPAGQRLHVVVVRPPGLEPAAASLAAAAANRLRAAGYAVSVLDMGPGPVWRMAPGTAKPGESAAIFLPGSREQAVRVCRVAGCSAPPAEVAGNHRALFLENFHGREIAVYVWPGTPPQGEAK